MPVVTRRELLEAGVHFGHQTRRWNPKMQRFLYGERSGIYIIDLERSLEGLEQSYAFVRDLGASVEITVRSAGHELLAVMTPRERPDVAIGSAVALELPAEACVVLPA